MLMRIKSEKELLANGWVKGNEQNFANKLVKIISLHGEKACCSAIDTINWPTKRFMLSLKYMKPAERQPNLPEISIINGKVHES